MSHGTSGDQQWQDYANPRKSITRVQYARGVAEVALRAYWKIEFHDSVPISMAERRLTVKLKPPGEEDVAWAERLCAEMGKREPKTTSEHYAREIMRLKELHAVDSKLQVIRIGDLGIAALPVEAYATRSIWTARSAMIYAAAARNRAPCNSSAVA